MKTICLNMIVKNESHVIESTLDNITKNIRINYWVISDTGSTDNTMEIIKNYFEKKKIPGELVQHEWKDFAHNRTMALEAAYKKSDYVFIFDADDSFHGKFVLPKNLDADSYLLKFGDTVTYHRVLLANNHKKWCYKSVIHEYIICLEDHKEPDLIDGDYYIESGRTGARSQDPDKYLKDAKILEKAFHEETDVGLTNRYAFYCGQSYKDCGKLDESIEWYKKCLTLNNWYQEKFYSALTLGDLHKWKGDMLNALHYWVKSAEYDSDRMEGVVNAAEHYRNMGNHLLVNLLYEKFKNYKKYPKDKLFFTQSKHFDELEYQNSISAFYTGNLESGYEACKRIIMNNIAPQSVINNTFSNIHFYPIKNDPELFKAVNDHIKTNPDINADALKLWDKLFDKTEVTKHINKNIKNKKKPSVLISFTTCKRLDLFKQTMNSILHNWTDLEKIDYWLCVDDNSSDDDRYAMKVLYKWFDFYNKGPEEKGHRKSMNIIWDKLNELKPRYWIHMEDDFLFHQKIDYVTLSIKYLKELEHMNVQQILFNRNYAETIEGYKIEGHIPYSKDIVIHDFKQGAFPYQNCHYWPHYSFRPSMVNTKVILELGNYDSANQFFEMDYANKYADKGYKSAFFNKITCTHIGRLTSERGDSQKPNAYILNQEEQFCNLTKEEPPKPEPNKIKVVSLKRRPDRKAFVIKYFKEAEITEYEFFDAIDGKELEPTPELAKLFLGNDFGSRRGVLGCALSHYNLWKQLLNSKHDYTLIMEDDFVIPNNFKKKIESINLSEKELIFFGYHMFQSKRNEVYEIYDVQKDEVKIEPLDRSLFVGGTHCYSINKKGAKILCDHIAKNGIKHGIDYVMKIIPGLDVYESQPHLAFAEWNENGKQIDSDIQNIGDAIDLTLVEIKYPVEELYDFDNKIGNKIFIETSSNYGEGINSAIKAKFLEIHSIESSEKKYKECKEKFKSYPHVHLYHGNSSEILHEILKNTNDNITFWLNSNDYSQDDPKNEYLSKINSELDIINNYNTKNNAIVVQLKEDIPKNDVEVLMKDIVEEPSLHEYEDYIFCYNTHKNNPEKKEYQFNHNWFNQSSLKNHIESLIHKDKANNILEIGSLEGQTTCFLSNFYLHKSGSTLDSIDSTNEDKVIDLFNNNIQLSNNYHKITPHKETSQEFFNKNSKTFNFIYIDGSNNINDIENDLNNSFKCLKGDGILFINKYNYDYYEDSEDINTLIDRFTETNKEDIEILQSNNEFCFRKKSEYEKQFIFIPQKDQMNYDLLTLPKDLEMDNKFRIAAETAGCVGFNTLGFFKSKIDNLKVSPYFSQKDGIYVKKEYYNKYIRRFRIKIMCNWCSSQQLIKEWSNLYPNNRFDMTHENDNIDYFIIINKPLPNDYYEPEKTIIFQMEPWVYDETKNWGVKTWGEWATPDENKFYHVHTHRKYLNNVQWLESPPEVIPPFKKDLVMSIISQKNFDEGHIKRINFIKKFEETYVNFIDIYGQANFHDFINYKGQTDKSDFAHYKYTFSVENNAEYNYATEKIWEPILNETLCFYWGCPNLENYIDSRAFIRLDLDDFETSSKIIIQAIEEDWWSKRIDIIRREKNKIINKLGFFPTLEKIINKFNSQEDQDKYLELNVFNEHKNGFFVDVGAHDGLEYNNTLYFENKNDWKGINIEPNETVFERLTKNRPNCINLQFAVDTEETEKEFICNQGYCEMISGLKCHYDPRHEERLNRESKVFHNETNIIKVQTKRLDNILKENNINHINYLNIDVEGAELAVIKSINFDECFIDVIGFENNFPDKTIQILGCLRSKNYETLDYVGVDILMINKQSQFYKK